MKIFKSLYSDHAGTRASHAAMFFKFYRLACDIRRSVGSDLCTPERIARDHNETQEGNQ